MARLKDVRLDQLELIDDVLTQCFDPIDDMLKARADSNLSSDQTVHEYLMALGKLDLMERVRKAIKAVEENPIGKLESA